MPKYMAGMVLFIPIEIKGLWTFNTSIEISDNIEDSVFELDYIQAFGIASGARPFYHVECRADKDSDLDQMEKEVMAKIERGRYGNRRKQMKGGRKNEKPVTGNTSMQMKPLVLGYVEHYQNDFLKYNREMLRKKPERFILCYRKTGTDFVTLDKWDEMTREDIQDNLDLVRTSI